MQMYDLRLGRIQCKRIRETIINIKSEHPNLDMGNLIDQFSFLEDILHLYDEDIDVINISRREGRKGRKE